MNPQRERQRDGGGRAHRRRRLVPRLVFLGTGLTGALGGCGPSATVQRVADALTDVSRGDAEDHRSHWREMMSFYAARDPVPCLPEVARVFEPPVGFVPSRRVAGVMPHYDWFDGPVRFRVGAEPNRFVVSFTVALDLGFEGGTLQLPDCALEDQLEGKVVCEGTPYMEAEGREACPDSGRFEAPASPENVKRLLAYWSREVASYFNRDAAHYGLPVRYAFTFFAPRLGPPDGVAPPPVDTRMPLANGCARRPYFEALRVGWSTAVLAHEVAHFLGLLDEYETLSGIFYEKTPFVGSEDSRMGLSMKPETRLLPFHHYLILRWTHCSPPRRGHSSWVRGTPTL
ncbi:MAG: hypothetical protein AAF928_21405 [Myxococcota bacterium]